MLLKDLLTLFSYGFKDFDIKNPDSKTQAINYLNLAMKEVYNSHPWEFKKRHGQLILTPNYTTGTCSITKYDGTNDLASRTVSFTGSSLTQNMVGRFFQPYNSSKWYKIIYINSDSVTLDTPIIDNSASGVSFKIWKKFYYLKSDVSQVIDFLDYDSNFPIDYQSSPILGYNTPIDSTSGGPFEFTTRGVDQFDDSQYTTGSVSGSKNSDVLTGSGTEFLKNVDSGDVIIVNSKNYRVKRVETDTRVILWNYLVADIATGTSYKAIKDNPLGIQFYFTTDSYRVLRYSYLGYCYDLMNEDYDLLPMPEMFTEAIISRAKSMKMSDDNNSLWAVKLQLYDAELTGLKQKFRPVRPRYFQFSPKISSAMPGRFGL